MLMKNRFLPQIFLSVFCCIATAYLTNYYRKKQVNRFQHRIETLQEHYDLLNHWLEIKNEGKSVATYFEDMGYKHIAVYGMAELGTRLMEDLEGSPIYVDYGIDRDICCSMGRIDKVYFPEDELPETDVIVVTPYSSFETIKKILEEKMNCPIISLEHVVWSV